MAILRLVLLALAVYLVASALAIHYYGLWGALGSVVLLWVALLIGKRMAGKLVQNLFFAPFKAKGAVLRNAEVRVLSVEPAPTPLHEQVVESPTDVVEGATPTAGATHDWYYLDVTITPRGTPTPFTLWEPSEIVLVGLDANPDELEDSANDLGQVYSCEIWRDGAWTSDDIGKYQGPQRVRLHAGIRTGERRARFRYYFEIFGHLELPSPGELAAGSRVYEG